MADRSQSSAGIIIEKTAHGLVPASAFDAERMALHAIGAQFDVKPLRARSNPQNRLYWQMLSRVVDITKLGDLYPTAPKLHDAALRDLGFVTVSYELATGKPFVTRDSTAFNNMTADEFREYFDRAVARLSELVGSDVLAFAEQAT